MHVQTFGGAVKKREPGEILPEKKCSLEINSRELGTLRCAKCLIDACVFGFFVFFFLPPFSKSSVPQQLCVLAQRFSKYKFLYVGSISAFQSLLYLQLGSSRKGEQRHSTCRYEYCHFYLIRVYSLTENHVMQQTYKKADVLVKKLTVTKESQRKTPYYACYCLHS